MRSVFPQALRRLAFFVRILGKPGGQELLTGKVGIASEFKDMETPMAAGSTSATLQGLELLHRHSWLLDAWQKIVLRMLGPRGAEEQGGSSTPGGLVASSSAAASSSSDKCANTATGEKLAAKEASSKADVLRIF